MMHINRWGHEHDESHAYDAYSREITKLHKDFEISKPGFFIDVTRPYVGATPDGIISCFCCGKGSLRLSVFIVTRNHYLAMTMRPFPTIA